MARKGYGVRKRINDLKNNDPNTALGRGLLNAALYVIRYLRRQWAAGIGGTGETLQRPEINAAYKKRKVKKLGGGAGKIDMLSPAKGDHMTQAVSVKNRTGTSATVGFITPTANIKARANYNRRPQFFELSDSVKKTVGNIIRGLTK